MFASSLFSKAAALTVGVLCALLFATSIPSSSAWVVSPLTTRSAASSRLFMSDGGAETAKGTVKWFDTIKGFGFIAPDDGSGDVFVHQTAIQMEGFRSLADGEQVEYKVETDNNGRKKAVEVTGPDGAEVQGAPFKAENDFNY